MGGNFELNDLWEFNPSTSEWVWISGSSTVPNTIPGPPGVYGTLGQPAAGNVPGGRSGAVGWIDSKGNLWLFGGNNEYLMGGNLNDLWEFNPSTNQWAWMGPTIRITNRECTERRGLRRRATFRGDAKTQSAGPTARGISGFSVEIMNTRRKAI